MIIVVKLYFKLFKPIYRWALVGISVSFLSVTIWGYVETKSQDFVRVVFFDVGQGDAIFIETPQGNRILLDGGPDNSLLMSLFRYLPVFSRRLDLLLLSHFDSDHIGGLLPVSERLTIVNAMMPCEVADSSLSRELCQRLASVNQENLINNLPIPYRLVLDQGVYLEILAPEKFLISTERNVQTLVTRLVVGSQAVLLTGDLPLTQERRLMNTYGHSLESEILKVAHHGSKNSTSLDFLALVQPVWSVISVGRNSYGQPHAELVERLNKTNQIIKRTDELGDVEFRLWPDRTISWENS